MLRIVVVFLIAVGSLSVGEGKVVTGSVRLNGVNTEEEMAKFDYVVSKRPNTVEIKVWTEKEEDAAYVQAGSPLSIYGYSHDAWTKAKRATTCVEKVRLSRWRSGVRAQQREKTGNTKRSREFTMRRSVLTKDRTQVWYFVLADCTLEQYFHDKTIPLIKYRVEMTQFDGSQLPVSERGVGYLYCINVIVSGMIFLWLCIEVKRSFKTDGVWPHAAIALLSVAVFFDILSSVSELIHLRLYARNGIGSYFLDALAAQCEAATDASIAFIFLTIGAGYTLRSSLIDYDSKSSLNVFENSSHENFILLAQSLRIPFAFTKCVLLFLGVHLLLAQWSRIYNDDFDSFHDFEHLPGRILVLLRVVCTTLFIPILLRTQRCAGDRLRRFLISWTALGTAWFLHLPLLVLIAHLFPAYTRHRLVSGFGALVQSLALGGLVALFTGAAKSYYLAVSTVNRPDANLDSNQNSFFKTSSGAGIESGFTASNFTYGDPDLRLRKNSPGGNLATDAASQPSAVKFGKLKIRVD